MRYPKNIPVLKILLYIEKKTFFKTLRHCKLNAMYTLKSLRESCTKFTAFGYKYCIELSKRFCKLVVIYAVKEFCIKYLTCELTACGIY